MAKQTQEVPRSEWKSFLGDFSRAHEGWLATVEVVGFEIGDQVETRARPLRGISTDVAGPGEHKDEKVEVIVGAGPHEHLTHIVSSPEAIRLEQTRFGQDETLEIESQDGTRTLVRLQIARLPGARRESRRPPEDASQKP
jgi:hypothetical protein